MPSVVAETIESRFNEIRSASTAGGGTALTTTAVLISVPLGASWLSLTPRNFSGAVVAQFLLNPFLYVVWTTNSLGGSVGSGYATNDISLEMQDGDATDFAISSWNTAANGGYIYVGSPLQFRGAKVTIGTTVNTQASVLTVKYWGSSWKDITATDGTGGATTMGSSGNVTWTVPTDWASASLNVIGDSIAGSPVAKSSFSMSSCYWTRWEVGTQLDDDCNIREIRALNRSTAYAELVEGQPYSQSITTQQFGGIACVEALVNAGTGNLIVNTAVDRNKSFV